MYGNGDSEIKAGSHLVIEGVGYVLPRAVMTAEDVAAASGIPAQVIRDKFGLRQKHVAGPGETVSTLAAEAGRRAMADAGVGPEEIDAVIYFGSPHKDYYVWLAAPRIQALLGLRQAFAFEVSAVSAGLPFALETARGLLAVRPDLRRILIVGASTESHLLNYRNHTARFMFNFGDGGAAAVVSREPAGRGPAGDGGSSHGNRGAGHPGHVRIRARIYPAAFRTDGRFAEFVRVPAGGSLLPASHATVASGLHAFEVSDPLTMKEMLDPVTVDNFVAVAREALSRAGFDGVDVLLPLHTKRSLFETLCEAFGVTSDHAVYLDDTGHISAIDPLLGLARLHASRSPLLQPGTRILMLTAGTGYNWAACAVRWEGDA